MTLQNKHFLILGFGQTGQALMRFLSRRQAQISIFEDHFNQINPEIKNKATALGARLLDPSQLASIDWQSIHEILLSPGVALTHPILQQARSVQIPITGELEFAARFSHKPIVAITGTNGKSTTTELVGLMFEKAGQKPAVGGNLGTPWVDLIDQKPESQSTILEVSSFQLETIQTFHPHIAALLNITDDHFERHGSMAEYAAAKAKIFQNQTPTDFFIYNDDDVQVVNLLDAVKAKKIPFSLSKKVPGIYCETKDKIESLISGQHRQYPTAHLPLQGLHNLENMMAAIAIAEAAGISQKIIQSALEDFKPLPHRLELVRNLNGVRYYDDSKGTNVGAVVMSLASFDEPILLILGGKDKGGDYDILKSLLRHKVKALLLIGEAAPKLASVFQKVVPLYKVETLERAVQQAQQLAESGDVVLLSPACSSFDQFRDYKHRGEEFVRLVKELS